MTNRFSRATIDRVKHLDIFEVARHLAIQIDTKGFTLCFMHEERHPSLYFSRKKNSYHCFGCGKGGGVVQLVMEHENWSFTEAVTWLVNEFHIVDSALQSYSARSVNPVKLKVPAASVALEHPPVYQPDTELLDWIIHAAGISSLAKRFLLEERGYRMDVLKRCKIGSITYAQKFVRAILDQFGEERCLKSGIICFDKNTKRYYSIFPCPCILFPYYDESGKIYTIQARSLGHPRKYMFPMGHPTFIFHIQDAIDATIDEPVYIAEGPTDCLAFLSEGKKSIGIPGAHAFRGEYVQWLKDKSLVMYADNDPAGESLYHQVNELLKARGNSVHRLLLDATYNDYSDYYARKYCKKNRKR